MLRRIIIPFADMFHLYPNIGPLVEKWRVPFIVIPSTIVEAEHQAAIHGLIEQSDYDDPTFLSNYFYWAVDTINDQGIGLTIDSVLTKEEISTVKLFFNEAVRRVRQGISINHSPGNGHFPSAIGFGGYHGRDICIFIEYTSIGSPIRCN